MSITDQVAYWRTSGERSWETARYLFKGKRYDACLLEAREYPAALPQGKRAVKINTSAEPTPLLKNPPRYPALLARGRVYFSVTLLWRNCLKD